MILHGLQRTQVPLLLAGQVLRSIEIPSSTIKTLKSGEVFL
jgi:hypothetical protein